MMPRFIHVSHVCSVIVSVSVCESKQKSQRARGLHRDPIRFCPLVYAASCPGDPWLPQDKVFLSP